MIGIYKITSPSGRVYIGQSINIERRFREYKSHRCVTQTKLHRSFMKYGALNHDYKVLAECELKDLNKLERYYQDLYNVLEKGLNCLLTKSGDKSGVLSKETRVKIGEKSKGRVFSEEYKKNMSRIMKGRVITEEWRAKLSKSAKERGVIPSMFRKHKLKGEVKLSDEHKKKISENSGTAKKVICSLTQKVWPSIAKCAIENNMNPVTLNRMLNGKRKNKTTLMLLDHE
ncbi:GIY-YIG nuclease family protein [Chryseobacterium cucumeris]|uniref:GIY-YIG nuclease family protein n=1 Tax=Chryseobacterium cucumeris TaxID=1813611 RepID=UPI003208804E